ncbi:MAG: cell division protein SepF [Lachnospiraceae bacterium]|jgi:cell division inhibitor SepF|nr:cell division protein SepF [Lachnospiraceae bacterium]MCI1329197.1 cell division protein SepF [Lachnospiraceae bacterium]
MSFLDKFLNAVRLNDDYDDDDEFFDDEDDLDEEEPETSVHEEKKPKNRFFNKMKTKPEPEEEEDEPSYRAPKSESKPSGVKLTTRTSSKVTPMRSKASARDDMEVSVIKPNTMEDTREIADTLLSNCTVVLNLEGIDVELAQRIIDFACGTCYAIDGSLQKVSSYIFILTPAGVEISGDIQDILNGGIPTIRSDF